MKTKTVILASASMFGVLSILLCGYGHAALSRNLMIDGEAVVANVAGFPEYMQDMTSEICSDAAVGSTAQLKDRRDGASYWVAKLADGKCWMTQDLGLRLNTGVTLTPQNTDITSNYTPSISTANNTPLKGTTATTADLSWHLGNYYLKDPTALSGCGSISSTATAQYDLGRCSANFLAVTGSTLPGSLHYKAGVYYTYAAATAMTGNNVTGGVDGNARATGSICPKGWRLPVGGMTAKGSSDYLPSSANEFYQLMLTQGFPTVAQYTETSSGGWIDPAPNDRESPRLAREPTYFNRPGWVYKNNNGGGVSAPGAQAVYWSSSPFDASSAQAFYAYIGERKAYPAYKQARNTGGSVRCVAR